MHACKGIIVQNSRSLPPSKRAPHLLATSHSMHQQEAFIRCAELATERDYLSRSQDPRGPQRDIELLKLGVEALALIRLTPQAQHVLEALQAVVLREPVLACELALASAGWMSEVKITFSPPKMWQSSQTVYTQMRTLSSSDQGTWFVSDVSCWVAEPRNVESAAAEPKASGPKDPGLADDGRLFRRSLFARPPSTAVLQRAGALALLRALRKDPRSAARSRAIGIMGPAAGLVPPLDAVGDDYEGRLARAAVYQSQGFRREEQMVMDSLRLEQAARSRPFAKQPTNGAIAQAEARELRAHAMSLERQQRKQRLAALRLAAKGPKPEAPPKPLPPPEPPPALDHGWMVTAITSTLVRPAVPYVPPAKASPDEAEVRAEAILGVTVEEVEMMTVDPPPPDLAPSFARHRAWQIVPAGHQVNQGGGHLAWSSAAQDQHEAARNVVALQPATSWQPSSAQARFSRVPWRNGRRLGAIAGGWRIGDRVVSRIDQGVKNVVAGDMGTVMGPCENASLANKANRVLVDFDSKGLLNVWESNILGAAGDGQVERLSIPFAVPFAACPFASSPLPPQGHEHAVVDAVVVAEVMAEAKRHVERKHEQPTEPPRRLCVMGVTPRPTSARGDAEGAESGIQLSSRFDKGLVRREGSSPQKQHLHAWLHARSNEIRRWQEQNNAEEAIEKAMREAIDNLPTSC